MPDCGPLGETLLEASERAIVDAFFLKSPAGGCVESVFTCATHFRFLVRCAISRSMFPFTRSKTIHRATFAASVWSNGFPKA